MFRETENSVRLMRSKEQARQDPPVIMSPDKITQILHNSFSEMSLSAEFIKN